MIIPHPDLVLTDEVAQAVSRVSTLSGLMVSFWLCGWLVRCVGL